MSTTPTHLSEMVQRLQTLGAKPPTPESRAEVDAHLFSKWHGIQVTAGRVLAAWGGRESVAALRAWMLRLNQPGPKASHRQRQHRAWLTTRKEAGNCLARCVQAEDADWLLDLYFSHTHREWQNCYELGAAIAALPEDVAFPRLEAALRRGPPQNQFAVLGMLGYTSDPLTLLQRLAARIDEMAPETQQDIRRRIGWWSTPPAVRVERHPATKRDRSPAVRPSARGRRPH